MRIPGHSTVLAVLAFGAGLTACPQYGTAGEVLSAVEAGARFGQATAAAKFCPAGIITDKGKALPEGYSGAEADTFKAEADKVVEAWTKAANCNELTMDSRELALCRTGRLRTCRAAWAEIGPEGTAVPGLIDANYDSQ